MIAVLKEWITRINCKHEYRKEYHNIKLIDKNKTAMITKRSCLNCSKSIIDKVDLI